jgi:hypothetical protein
MKKAVSTAIILLIMMVLILSSCRKVDDPLNLGLQSIDAEGLDGEDLDEARKLAGWRMDPTGTFSYLEYFPQGSSRPYFDETFEFNDNYFIYETTVNGDRMYGYMDQEFSKLSGALSLEPGVFMYNLARVKDGSGVHAIDTSFLPVDTYLANFAKKGSTLIQVAWTNEPDETPLFLDNLDYDKYLVPVMQTSNMETGIVVDGRIWGYKTFNDAYIGNPNGPTPFKIEAIFEEARGFFHGLAAVKLGGKWGFIDESGEIVVDFQFDRVSNFNGTVARVFKADVTVDGAEVKDRWALVDNQGNMLTDFYFAIIGEFENNIAIAGYATLTSNNRNQPQTRIAEVYLKSDGNLLVNQTSTGVALREFSEGKAIIRNSSVYTYINEEGTKAVPGSYYSAENFSDGMAAVKMSRTSMRWGYIDENGNQAIAQNYIIAKPFDDGYAYVRDSMATNGTLIDKTGKKYLEELKLTGISKFNDDGYALGYAEITVMRTMTNADTGESWDEEVQETHYYMIHIE